MKLLKNRQPITFTSKINHKHCKIKLIADKHSINCFVISVNLNYIKIRITSSDDEDIRILKLNKIEKIEIL